VSTSDRRAAPRRTPASGGYARGEETRARIINAAFKVFGEEGYARASTRQIAREAGVTPPVLQYHFDSKEGLHRACAEFLIAGAGNVLPAALETGGVALANDDPKAAAEALCGLLEALVDASSLKTKEMVTAQFTARTRAEGDTPGGVLLREQIVVPILDLAARLIACANRTEVDAMVRLRASIILSQVSAVHVHRDGTLESLGWQDFNGVRREMVKAVIRAHTLAALATKIG
jgi:TetR/AcrR family transcriptional regulator, regulator of cefoperazone and chloramphenicol sensitivity